MKKEARVDGDDACMNRAVPIGLSASPRPLPQRQELGLFFSTSYYSHAPIIRSGRCPIPHRLYQYELVKSRLSSPALEQSTYLRSPLAWLEGPASYSRSHERPHELHGSSNQQPHRSLIRAQDSLRDVNPPIQPQHWPTKLSTDAHLYRYPCPMHNLRTALQQQCPPFSTRHPSFLRRRRRSTS